MEIEVGDWIRSKDGFIGRVRRITYDDMEKSNYYICEKDNVMASNYLENIVLLEQGCKYCVFSMVNYLYSLNYY